MPEPERVTIRRIAGELNLSSSTVSRALAGRPEISPETTRRVIETARRLGYRPPPEKRTVILILPDTDTPLQSYSTGMLTLCAGNVASAISSWKRSPPITLPWSMNALSAGRSPSIFETASPSNGGGRTGFPGLRQ